MTLESKVKVKYTYNVTGRNANSFIFTASVYIWHNDSLWCVDTHTMTWESNVKAT